MARELPNGFSRSVFVRDSPVARRPSREAQLVELHSQVVDEKGPTIRHFGDGLVPGLACPVPGPRLDADQDGGAPRLAML